LPTTSKFPDLLAGAYIGADKYTAMYEASISDPEAFWGEQGKRLDWIKPYTKVKNTSFAYDNVDIRWYEDGTLNVAANCIDRHLATRGDQTAILFEPDDPNEAAQHITYAQLGDEVGRLANTLKSLGVKRGDRVVLYLPMIPEAAMPCLPARASARSTPWSSRASRLTHWQIGSMTRKHGLSSLRTAPPAAVV